MADNKIDLDGQRVLVAGGEADLIKAIENILEMANVVIASDFETALRRIRTGRCDLMLLDIMGDNSMVLLEEAVNEGISTVMLTSHTVNPDMLMSFIRRGAISYIPREALTDLKDLLERLLAAKVNGTPSWKLLADKLVIYFDDCCQSDGKAKNEAFWLDFSCNWEVGRGIQERLNHDKRLLDKRGR